MKIIGSSNVKLFAAMFVGMAPLTCMPSVISEEKEKNTLRALMMSNVRPVQYLLGVGSYIWLMCMIGTVANFLVAAALFLAAYKKKGLE